jgi:hypothetical protein
MAEIHLIHLWLVGTEFKPIIIRDANKALHLVFPGTLARLRRGLLV